MMSALGSSARRSGWAPALAPLVFVAAACRTEPPPPTPAPLCYRAAEQVDGAIRPLDAAGLIALLVGPERATSESVRRDCSGEPIEEQLLGVGCSARGEPSEARSYKRPSPEAVVARDVGGGLKAVWVASATEGESELGPVALVREQDGGARVVAIGALSKPVGEVDFRLETLGEAALLVAESERCEPANDPASCVRSARFLAREGSLLRRLGEGAPGGACEGPAEITLERSESVALATGWTRRFTLSAALDVEGDTLVIHQQVVVEEADPRVPGLPPRRVRVADADQRLRLVEGTLIADSEPLWDRLLALDGSLRLEH